MTTPPRRKSTREAIRIEVPSSSSGAGPPGLEERRRAETRVLRDEGEDEASPFEFEILEVKYI